MSGESREEFERDSMGETGERNARRTALEANSSVILAAEAYAQKYFESTGVKFDIAELIRLKGWFYAGARWARENPEADVAGPQSSTMEGR